MRTSLKLFLLVLSLMVCIDKAFSQIAYYDAIDLKGKLRDTTFASNAAGIFLKYYKVPGNQSTDETITSLNDSLNANPFLKGLRITTGAPHGALKSSAKIMNAVGGLDVTNIAHGIAQFMIERAKQELTIAFFNRFKKFSETYPEFNVLFPTTTDNLANLLAHSYPEMLPALRTGFLEDVTSITYHLDDVFELPKYQELLKKFPELKVAIRTIRLVNELQTGETHASILLEDLAALDEWNEVTASTNFKNFGSSIKLAKVLSASVRKSVDFKSFLKLDTLQVNDTFFITQTFDTLNYTELKHISVTSTIKKFSFTESIRDVINIRDSINEKVVRSVTSIENDQQEHAWISFKELKSLVTDSMAFRIYVGLLYEMVKDQHIQFLVGNNRIDFASIMAEHKDDLFLFENKLTEFIELANKVDNALDTLKGKQHFRSGLINDELFNYIDVSLDVIEYGISVGKLFSDKIDVDQYCSIARNTNELFRNVYRQEYTQAVSNAMDILDDVAFMVEENKNNILIQLQPSFKNETVFSKPYDQLTKEDHDKIERLRITTTIPGTKILFEKYSALRNSKFSLASFSKVLMRTTRYGLFMANMVKAESPDEVSALLETTVLPVGSSSIKKNSGFNMAIQSYLGGFGAFSKEDNDESSWNSPFGVIAPIGLSLSAGLGKGGALSLFLPLLDIGAVVDYQLKGNTIPSSTGIDSVVVTKDYSIRLGQVLSPGAYLVWGLPWEIPLSLGIGSQYGPGLGKLDDDAGPVVNNPRWRSNFFLAVDIPFYNLVNVPKHYNEYKSGLSKKKRKK